MDATYFAAGAKRRDVYRLVLERGGDASNALSHAVWGNQFELAEIALAHGRRLTKVMAEILTPSRRLSSGVPVSAAARIHERRQPPLTIDKRDETFCILARIMVMIF